MSMEDLTGNNKHYIILLEGHIHMHPQTDKLLFFFGHDTKGRRHLHMLGTSVEDLQLSNIYHRASHVVQRVAGRISANLDNLADLRIIYSGGKNPAEAVL